MYTLHGEFGYKFETEDPLVAAAMAAQVSSGTPEDWNTLEEDGGERYAEEIVVIFTELTSVGNGCAASVISTWSYGLATRYKS